MLRADVSCARCHHHQGCNLLALSGSKYEERVGQEFGPVGEALCSVRHCLHMRLRGNVVEVMLAIERGFRLRKIRWPLVLRREDKDGDSSLLLNKK